MRELILVMAKVLVDKPDEVETIEIAGDVSVIFELRVASKEGLVKIR
jgi:predicted RNA-binding protein YlqC (UPF0109 family)